MADKTTQSIVIDAPPAQVMAVIADFEAYPEWAQAVKVVEVLERGDDGRGSHVRFELDAGMVKDTYELTYTWAPDGCAVSWKLVKGQMQKAQEGSYTLRPRGESTEVTYSLAVDLAIPMIGMFKRKAEKVITDTALKELKKRVEG
ncbi:SRPBCC family protein [Rhodococcus sp. X156]|uniref:SRPBCC family protein n=1 Tax=Rhodococcus sp. X156 TaxID=2499145 RepID=UPI000FDBA662|nr:SRPBCC family protein [Rhodococcus sp. X156]